MELCGLKEKRKRIEDFLSGLALEGETRHSVLIVRGLTGSKCTSLLKWKILWIYNLVFHRQAKLTKSHFNNQAQYGR